MLKRFLSSAAPTATKGAKAVAQKVAAAPAAAASRTAAAATESTVKPARKTIKINVEHAGSKSGDFFLVNQPDFRVFVTADGKRISPWHDLPMMPLTDGSREGKYLITFVNEIPRGSTAKMEISTKEAGNPIKQDIKKEKLRHYPFASLVNYGAIPQTWENPNVEALPGLKGDNDPVDVCDIGGVVLETGQVTVAKVLGILGMVDEGEMDWKVIAINRDDRRSEHINTIADVERVMPGKLKSIVQWFKQYKVPDGKPLNTFAFDDQAKDADYAMEIITKTHEHWKDQAAIKAKGLWIPEKK